jgi:hypothetical protein
VAQILSKVRTLHAMAQLGYRVGEPLYSDSADSIVSLIALNLKHEQVVVPDAMVPHYERLKTLTESPEKSNEKKTKS